jgi:hypothetical protein
VRLPDNVQVFVAAHEHMLPLGHGGQADIGNRRLERGLLGILVTLLMQQEILAEDVKATVASGNRLLGDAHEGKVRVCGRNNQNRTGRGGGRACNSPLSRSAQRALSVVTSRPLAPER